MLCCPNCFQHKWLKERIAELSKQKNKCEFCGSEYVPVLEASELGDYFYTLLRMYEKVESGESCESGESREPGESLISLIQRNWHVFDEDTLNEDTQAELLEKSANSYQDEYGEGPPNARDLYKPVRCLDYYKKNYTHRDRWEDYRSQVRDNPDEPLPFEDYLTLEFEQISIVLPYGTTFYRARRGFSPGEHGERRPFQGNDIGAPPAERVHAGRANVEGQRVLYCADQEATAVAEVRPARGFYVSVAPVTLNREIMIVDLDRVTPAINPFVNGVWEMEIQSLLAAFAEEMSRPLERDDDPAHYVPCQRLAGYIWEAGEYGMGEYDGIRYPSALNPKGTNVILFDPAIADVGESKLVKITKTSLEYEHEKVDPLVQRIAGATPRLAEPDGDTGAN